MTRTSIHFPFHILPFLNSDFNYVFNFLFNILDSSAKSECLVHSQTPSGNKSDVVIGVWPGLESTGIRKELTMRTGEKQKDSDNTRLQPHPK